MKDVNEYHGPNCVPPTETLLSAIAGITLVTICLVAPARAATFEKQLQEFLQGPPFEYTLEFQELKPAGEVAKVEDPQPTLGLPPLTSKTVEPTLEQIREFAEAVLNDYL
jgi:hypothetical protein